MSDTPFESGFQPAPTSGPRLPNPSPLVDSPDPGSRRPDPAEPATAATSERTAARQPPVEKLSYPTPTDPDPYSPYPSQSAYLCYPGPVNIETFQPPKEQPPPIPTRTSPAMLVWGILLVLLGVFSIYLFFTSEPAARSPGPPLLANLDDRSIFIIVAILHMVVGVILLTLSRRKGD